LGGTNGSRISSKDLRSRPPELILRELESIEREIFNQVRKGLQERRSGVRLLDWLVDQVLFVVEVQKWELRTEDDLWLLEMLSLPECVRQARLAWQKAALINHALIKGNLRWQDVMRCRSRRDLNSISIWPRASIDLAPRQLGPYIAGSLPPRGFPFHGTYRADLTLKMQQLIVPLQDRGLLTPVHPLPDGLTCLTVEITLGTIRKPASNFTVFLDLPRQNDPAAVSAALEQMLSLIDITLQNWDQGAADGLANSAHQEHNKQIQLNAPTIQLMSTLRRLRRNILADIPRLRRFRKRRSGTTKLLQKYLRIPQATYRTSVRVLPVDCQESLLPVILGAWVYELMTRREKHQFRQYVWKQLFFLSASTLGTERGKNEAIDFDKMGALVPGIIKALRDFNRPFSGASIRAYLRKSLKRARSQDPSVLFLKDFNWGQLKGEDLAREGRERLENPIDEEEEVSPGSLDDGPELPKRHDEFDPISVQTRFVRPLPGRKDERTSSNDLPRSFRVPRGGLQKVARNLGCSPRTAARTYDRYRLKHRLKRSPDNWGRFVKWALYGVKGRRRRKQVG